MRRWKSVLLGSAAMVLVVAPVSALASPGYLSSDPADGDSMNSAPETVRVVFDQPLEPGGTLIVVDECNRRIDDDSSLIIGSTISVGFSKTPKGIYAAMWKVRAPGGVGGGDSTGRIEFTVTSGKSCGPKAEPVDHSGHDTGGDGGPDTDHSNHNGGTTSDGSTDHSNHNVGTTSDGVIDHSNHNVTLGDSNVKGPGSGKNSPKVPEVDVDTPPVDAPQNPTLAGGLEPIEEIAGSMVLTALLTSLVLGAAGGWIVRNLTPG